ncbi:MAG: S8 family serine peptidase [Thalassobaculaceae bacterium]|nr:S8 family serine peptidase [Thalassobaculaceae bacterium]
MAYEYKVNGQPVRLDIATDLLAVRFREPAPYSARSAAMNRMEISGFDDRIEIPKQKLTLFRTAPRPGPLAERIEEAAAAVGDDAAVDRCSPVFKHGGVFGAATNTLIVGFDTDVTVEEMDRLLAIHGGRRVRGVADGHVVELPVDADPFVAAQALDGETGVAFAEPNFTVFGERLLRSGRSGAPHSGQPIPSASGTAGATNATAIGQYALDLTQAHEAWRYQRANPSLRIAILDEGVDTRHPDLSPALVGTYDGIDDDTYQEPNSWDSHGTACAGIAGAAHNAIGIKGIAGGCGIIAVRIARSMYVENRARYLWMTDNASIARAIDWAWRNGADVLSNSWGGGLPSTLIERAITDARTKGRNGLGAVVVCAAGNDGGAPSFPSSLSDVLTVGATNQYDEPKTRQSADGENWASNQGPAVDIAAPGVLIATTDNIDRDGRNRSPGSAGNYVTDFNGTSSATPMVAGAAALVLSADPSLTEVEVRDILRHSADKVGTVTYQDGHNPMMGYGRLNLRRAVQMARGLPAPATLTGADSQASNVETEPGDRPAVLARHEGATGTTGGSDEDWSSGLALSTAPAAFTGTLEPSALTEAEVAGPQRDIAAASFGDIASPIEAPAGPLTVVGRDDRDQLNDTTLYPWRAIASLRITAADGSIWWGTGWFAGPRTVVTAGHVVFIRNDRKPRANGWVRRIDVMPGRNGRSLPFGWVASTVFRSVTGWTQDGKPEHDYGAIILPTGLGEKVGHLGIEAVSPADLRTSPVLIAGYPISKPAGTLWEHAAAVSSVGPQKIYYPADTSGGQSGAPVLRASRDGRPVAAGIHAYGAGRTGVNSAVRINGAVFQVISNWMEESS